MKRKFFRQFAIFLAFNMLLQAFYPTAAFALTSGPSQPEVQSFEPIGTSEMVDLFTGDFTYNIPLLDVEGYPVNISYHGGVSMDQEASWVGLGWNINPGVISRNMRGLPDEFTGSGSGRDEIIKELNIKPSRTYGISAGVSTEIFGIDKVGKFGLGFSQGMSFNNYTGISFTQTITPSFTASLTNRTSLTAGLGFSGSSHDGATLSPSLSLNSKSKSYDQETSFGATTSFNSRSGLKELSLSFNTQKQFKFQTKLEGGGTKEETMGVTSNGGSSITFGTSTYIPSISSPMINSSILFSLKLGPHALGIDATSASFSAYYSQQKLDPDFKTRTLRGYGYFNVHKVKNSKSALVDFNREKDASFTLNTPALPVTNLTYDVFSVSGQGIGGVYRPYRNDVGRVSDPFTYSTSESASIGAEIGFGNLVKYGGDVRVNDVLSVSGDWIEDNEARQLLRFSGNKPNDPSYETFFFKQAGEKSVDSEFGDPSSVYNKIGQNKPTRMIISKKGGYRTGLESAFRTKDGEILAFNEKITRKNRQKRNENITYLSVADARRVGIQKNLYDTALPEERRINSSAKDHHMAEISAVREDGSRYIYGIPAYNLRTDEVAFSVGDGAGKKDGKNLISPDNLTGLVHYDPGKDNSLENKHGLDNYFSRTTMPPYAHSYLLTAVLSPDFIDNDAVQGPSLGDMGSYTKFNYEKTSSIAGNYKWRVPLGANTASSNEGLHSLDTDDQANYIYGEKEVWYLKSVESKNFIAIFILGDRADGLGVRDENGAVEPQTKLKVLKQIKLYKRNASIEEIGTSNSLYETYLNSSEVALKTVNFEYDYSLCPNVDNNAKALNSNLTVDDNGFVNQGGKLTLKKIYFTYQNSFRAKFSPYLFHYADPDDDGVINSELNPSYNLKAYDRWGNYKPNTGNFRNNAEFPYVEQNELSANQYASSWNLTKIVLPSGGFIKVEYESDDYAFVQDRPAMQMFRLRGISGAAEISDNNFLYQRFCLNTLSCDGLDELNLTHDDSDHYNWLQIDVPLGTTREEFFNKYLNGIKDLYFRVKVYLDEGTHFDYVPGYAEIEDYQVIENRGLIKLKAVSLKEKANAGLQINPITKAALQFSRLYAAKVAFNQADATDGGIEAFVKALRNSNIFKNLEEIVRGVNKTLIEKNHCRKVDLHDSMIRLVNPSKTKYGGGNRVSKVVINDNANSAGMGQSGEYGQKYTYTTKDDVTGEEISSGVASYEPIMGGDENPFKEPVAFLNNKQEKLLIPDDRFYLEAPFGESFFPAPVIGYSKITVESIKPDGVKRHGTGKLVHEFYTAKDFPTITDRTDLKVIPKKSPLAFRLLKIVSKDYVTASQGFVVELNDMHGKPKAQWVYPEGDENFISGIEYKYRRSGNRLNNEGIPVVDPLGKIKEANIGIDYDVVVDTRDHYTSSVTTGINGNLATFFLVFVGSVPLFLPAYAKEDVRFKSSVVTKVINRYGILEETIVHDLGSSVSKKNLAFDSETGNLLLVESRNNFEDPVYSLSIPAHWGYDRMGQAYQNTGIELSLNFTSGRATLPADYEHLLVPGDELLIVQNAELDNSTSPDHVHRDFRYWVTKKEGPIVTVYGGQPLSRATYLLQGQTKVKVIRSGRRNMQNIAIGSVVSLLNPLYNEDGISLKANLDLENHDHRILTAGAIEFAEEYCDCYIPENGYNFYFEGARGNWRVKKNFTYLTGRTQSPTIANSRKDGVFTSFSMFWNLPANNSKWIKDETNWQWVSEVTAYNPYNGAELENVDPLDRNSAAIYNYNHSVPTAVSSNSTNSELFFDNFETSDKPLCKDKSFSSENISLDFRHTGRKSIKVPKGNGNLNLSLTNDCQDTP